MIRSHWYLSVRSERIREEPVNFNQKQTKSREIEQESLRFLLDIFYPYLIVLSRFALQH